MTTNNKYDDLEEIQFNETYQSANDSNKIHKKASNGALLTELFSYIKIIVVAVAIAFICNHSIIVNAMVPSGSMNDTIMENNRLIGFRLSYSFADPDRCDVAIFKFPDDETVTYIKRIIGLPGDVVVIKNGHVYVNGDELNEPYIKEPMNISSEELIYCVPEGHYFMLGDNRNDSADSRVWENTYVAKDKILAKAIFKYYDSHVTFEIIK